MDEIMQDLATARAAGLVQAQVIARLESHVGARMQPSALVDRYRSELKSAKTTLRTRSEAFRLREALSWARDGMREEKISTLKQKLADRDAHHEDLNGDVDNFRREIKGQYEFMLDQIMESRRGEQMALLRNFELTTMMVNRGTAGRSDDPAEAGRSDDPALNRAGGGPRRGATWWGR